MLRRPKFLPTRDYLCNFVVNRIPFVGWRMAAYRRLGMRVAPGSVILMATDVYSPEKIVIGPKVVINQHCLLDGRGGLTIGENVNISSHVLLVAGTHEVQSDMFKGYARSITIEDYVWLATRCTVLSGLTIGRGAVVASGAVVNKSVLPYTIVGGIPARKIGERNPDLKYTLGDEVSWL